LYIDRLLVAVTATVLLRKPSTYCRPAAGVAGFWQAGSSPFFCDNLRRQNHAFRRSDFSDYWHVGGRFDVKRRRSACDELDLKSPCMRSTI
jgi:hypothetical protein